MCVRALVQYSPSICIQTYRLKYYLNSIDYFDNSVFFSVEDKQKPAWSARG